MGLSSVTGVVALGLSDSVVYTFVANLRGVLTIGVGVEHTRPQG